MTKKIIIIIIITLIGIAFTGYILTDTLSSADDTSHSEIVGDKELGYQWAESYKEKYNTLKNIKDENLRHHISKYFANQKTYHIQKSDHDATNVMNQWKALVQYAKKHDLYPTDEEIEVYIKRHIEDAKGHNLPPIMEGKLEGLGLTIEEYYNDFERYSTIILLVQENVLDELKRNEVKKENESDSEFNERMRAKLNQLMIDEANSETP